MNFSKRSVAYAAIFIGGLSCQGMAFAQETPLAAPAQSIMNTKKPQPGIPQLNIKHANGHGIHIFPTVAGARTLAVTPNVGTAPLVYHSGGQVMQSLKVYTIFWVPPTLQTGAATSVSPRYVSIENLVAGKYIGSPIGGNNTQYYQTVSSVTHYVQNIGRSSVLTYTDTSAYPASGCSDSATPGNCITDAQIQAEIKKVMALKGWTGGMGNIFLLFTSKGEGSCFDGASASCAYANYCAYHGNMYSGTTPIIYGNEPYGDPSYCQVANTPTPQGDAEAEAAATAASHEMTEAITDPLGDAWYTSDGYEIGDLCAYKYGTNSWDAGAANQIWDGKYLELQMEYDNHASKCVQVGP